MANMNDNGILAMDLEDLENRVLELRATGMTWCKIANILNVERRSLYRIRVGMPKEATLDDEQLFEAVLDIKSENPHFGGAYVRGALLHRGFKIQRRRIRECLKIIDADELMQRRRPRIVRVAYDALHANFLWHLDGNEKLQMFFIYLHACVDGHSRKVIYLQCASNKKACTTLKMFYQATEVYGKPIFLRIDKGGENVRVAEFMEMNSEEQKSVIVGSSVRNQRVERFWREVNQITLPFKCLFRQLEIEGMLNVDDPIHLFSLHYIYLPRIQEALNDFAGTWDNHPIRTGSHWTPAALFVDRPFFETTHAPVYEGDNGEVMILSEQNAFAQSIISDPLFDDGNFGVNLYTNLVNAIHAAVV